MSLAIGRKYPHEKYKLERTRKDERDKIERVKQQRQRFDEILDQLRDYVINDKSWNKGSHSEISFSTSINALRSKNVDKVIQWMDNLEVAAASRRYRDMITNENLAMMDKVLLRDMNYQNENDMMLIDGLFRKIKRESKFSNYDPLDDIVGCLELVIQSIKKEVSGIKPNSGIDGISSIGSGEGPSTPDADDYNRGPRNVLGGLPSSPSDAESSSSSSSGLIIQQTDETAFYDAKMGLTLQDPCLPGLDRTVRGWRLMDGKLIGKGSFGKVYRVCKGSNCNFVAKKGYIKMDELSLMDKAADHGIAKHVIDAWGCRMESIKGNEKVLVTHFFDEIHNR